MTLFAIIASIAALLVVGRYVNDRVYGDPRKRRGWHIAWSKTTVAIPTVFLWLLCGFTLVGGIVVFVFDGVPSHTAAEHCLHERNLYGMATGITDEQHEWARVQVQEACE